MLPIFRIFAEIRNFCSPWKFLYLVFQLEEKNPQKKFFFVKNFFSVKKKTTTVPCNDFPQTKWRLNSPAQEEQKVFLEENGDRVLLRKENKKNGIRTPLVRKEDKKGGNEPQTTIFNLLTDKIGLHWHDRQFECDSESETDLKFGLHIYDLNLPIEAKLFSRFSAI